MDAARRTLRGSDRGGISGVLPAVSLQTQVQPQLESLESLEPVVVAEIVEILESEAWMKCCHTHVQWMRGVEASTRQLLIAARQVCSTVQGIHLVADREHSNTTSTNCLQM